MRKRILKKRNEKIKFLKELKTGRANISELSQQKFEVWFFDPKERTYTNSITNLKLTEEMYKGINQKEGIKDSDILNITLNID